MNRATITLPIVLAFLALFAIPAVYGSTAMPQRFFIDVDSLNITFSPQAPHTLQIAVGDRVVSYGQDWEVKKLKPYLFQLRQENWKGFFFQVNTDRKMAQKISGGTFGQLGGKRSYLRGRVKAVGPNTRISFSRLARPYIVVVPKTKAIQVAVQQCVLSYGRDLELAQLTHYIFHFRQKFWKKFHWQINTHRKDVHLIRDGAFGKAGGSLDAQSFGVRPVYDGKPDPSIKPYKPIRPVRPVRPVKPIRPTYKPVTPVKPVRPVYPIKPTGPIAFPGLPTKAAGQVRIKFPELAMTFSPDGKSLRIVAGNKVVCYGDGWKVSKESSNSFTLRQEKWKGFSYLVNTATNQLFVVKNGARRKLSADVRVIGRGNVRIGMGKSANPYIVLVPGTKTFQVVAFGHVLHYGAGWSRAQPQPHIIHLKNRNWRGFFWKVDTNRQVLTMIKSGKFGGYGGTEHRLRYKVEVR